jgi:hypothetical protein
MKQRYEQEERRELYCPKGESGEMSRKSEKKSLLGKKKQKRRQEICGKLLQTPNLSIDSKLSVVLRYETR